MKQKRSIFQIVDILGIMAYALTATSCFLPFLNYTTLTSTETITYFQSNGKLVLAFAILAILVIIIKRFKYTFICLGLSIGIYAYDIVLGLLAVVRQKTTVYNLRYGFYLLAIGMLMALIYIFLKKKSLDHEYEKQFKVEEINENVASNDVISKEDNNLEEQINVDSIQSFNPQMQLLEGYQFDDSATKMDHDSINDVVSPSKEERDVNVKELSFDDISLLEENFDSDDDFAKEELKPSLGEEVNTVIESNSVDMPRPTISIFNDVPNMEIADDSQSNLDQTLKDFTQPIKKKNVNSIYKLCDNCGMQINSDAEQCPVCGKYF